MKERSRRAAFSAQLDDLSKKLAEAEAKRFYSRGRNRLKQDTYFDEFCDPLLDRLIQWSDEIVVCASVSKELLNVFGQDGGMILAHV